MLRKNSGADRVSQEEFNLPLSQGVIENAESTPLFKELSDEYAHRYKTNRRKVAAEMVERSRAAWHQQLAGEADAEARLKESQRAAFSEMLGPDMPLSLSVKDNQIVDFISSLRGKVEQARLRYMDEADILSGASQSEIEQARQEYTTLQERWQLFDGNTEKTLETVDVKDTVEVYQIPQALEGNSIDSCRLEIKSIFGEHEPKSSVPIASDEINFEQIKKVDMDEKSPEGLRIGYEYISPTNPGPDAPISKKIKAKFLRDSRMLREKAQKVSNLVRGNVFVEKIAEKTHQLLFPNSFRARATKWFKESRHQYDDQRVNR